MGKKPLDTISFQACNAMLMIAGVGYLAIGAYTIGVYGMNLLNVSFDTNPYIVFMVFGIILMFNSVLAFLAVFKLNHILLQVVIGLLVLLLVLQIAVAGAAVFYYVNMDTRVDQIASKMKNELDKDPDAIVAIDKIQKEHKCCGAYGPSDYKLLWGSFSVDTPIDWFYNLFPFLPGREIMDQVLDIIRSTFGGVVPKSCKNGENGPTYQKGCSKVTKQLIERSLYLIMPVSLLNVITLGLQIVMGFKILKLAEEALWAEDIENKMALKKRAPKTEEEEEVEED